MLQHNALSATCLLSRAIRAEFYCGSGFHAWVAKEAALRLQNGSPSSVAEFARIQNALHPSTFLRIRLTGGREHARRANHHLAGTCGAAIGMERTCGRNAV